MRLLPRSFEYRSGDTAESVGTRLATWTRDVIAAFKRIPDVTYIEVPVASGGSADVESAGTPAAASVELAPYARRALAFVHPADSNAQVRVWTRTSIL